jgi:hypothetical protein
MGLTVFDRGGIMVLVHNDVVKIVHRGVGDYMLADYLVVKAQATIEVHLKRASRVAVYHDTSGLESANDAYMKAWAEIGKEFKNRAKVCFYVEKAWMRVMAKSAALLGGFDVDIFKSEAEVIAFLRANGFIIDEQRWSLTY